MRFPPVVALPLAIAITSFGFAEQWPQFRGPNGQAVTASKELPDQWAKDQHVAWSVEVPGVAWSQPVLWGDRIFVTTAITENQTKPKPGGGMGGGGFGGGEFAGGGRGRGPGAGGAPRGGDRPRDDA